MEVWKEDYKIYCCKYYSLRMEDGNIGLMDEKEGDEDESLIMIEILFYK